MHTKTAHPTDPIAPDRATDVLVLGGGLAGLSLALQLRRQDPGLQITVVERRAHPVREAAHKVGESTVEIGAHYFAETLGLRDHLEHEQIRKFGFRFFFSDGRRDIDRCTEVGVSRAMPTPSWQIDRGRFENALAERAQAAEVTFLDGAVVRAIALGTGDARHRVEIDHAGMRQTIDAGWVVDASGRAGLLKRKLGLARANAHTANAVWWRVDGLVDPNTWSDDADWHARCEPPERWRSTNHLCGEGYWVWLIPLASGAHSIGIVCDAALHPLDTMNTHAKAMDWLRRHQPRLATALEDPRHALQDFLFLRDFSYDCRQVLSADRWAIVGEAGMFLDPFYSPGSDFIAIANTFLCDLIARDRSGRMFGPYAGLYEQAYRLFYENTLALYQDQYTLFGDEQVMPIKVVWDYTYYWSLLAPLFFAGKLTDVAMLGRLRPLFDAASALNLAMQPMLRDWGRRNAGVTPGPGRLLDQFRIDWFCALNGGLCDSLDDEAFFARLADNVRRMHALAAEIAAQARRTHPEIETTALDALASADDSPESPPLLDPVWYAPSPAAPRSA